MWICQLKAADRGMMFRDIRSIRVVSEPSKTHPPAFPISVFLSKAFQPQALGSSSKYSKRVNLLTDSYFFKANYALFYSLCNIL
jgi:hypothetical protein